MHTPITLPLWALFLLLAGVLIIGVFFGWNNGKQATIAKIEKEAANILGIAKIHVAEFWAKVKAKL
jgi:hypothetical protein